MTAAVSPCIIPVAGAAFVRPITIGDGIRLYGSLSGYVGFKPAAAAGSTDYTMPSTDGTSGQALVTNGSSVLSWATVATNPAGVGTELQYRSGASTFGAVTGSSTANGGIALQAQSSSTVPWSVGLASLHTANAIELNSYGNAGGNLFKVSAAGNISFNGVLTATSVPLDLMATGLPYSGIRIASNGMHPLVSNSCDLGYAAGGFSWKSLQLVGRIGWDSGGTVDAGVCRNAAGVVEVNNGTAGTYRDLKLRSLYSVAGAATDVPLSVNLASGQTADAIQVTSYNGTAGGVFKVGASGFVYSKCFLTQSTYLIISDNGTPGFVYNGLSLRASGVDIRAGSASLVGWTASTDSYNNAFSVALGYSVAGVIEINNGTAGTYRDLKLRHLVATGQAYCPQQTLTDAASISWDLDTQPSAVVTLTDNRTLAAPTNQKAGATYILVVKQDATGSRTLTFNAVYKFAGGTAPTLTTTANAVDILTFVSDGTYMYGVCQNDLR